MIKIIQDSPQQQKLAENAKITIITCPFLKHETKMFCAGSKKVLENSV